MKHYHINCALILLHTHDKVLLQKRTKDAPTLPDHWGFFGGGIKVNETPQQAVVRETKEELGYTLSNFEFLLEKDFSLDEKSGHMHVFYECYDGQKIECFEGEKLDWFKEEDVASLKMKEHDKEVIYSLFQHLDMKQ